MSTPHEERSPAGSELRGHSGAHATKSFLRGSSLFLIGRLLSIAINFLVQVLAVRYLSKGDYGALSWALSIAAMGASTVLLGLNRGVGRFAAMQHERREYGAMFATVRLALLTVTGLGLVVVLATLGLRGWITAGEGGELSVGLLMVLIALVPLDALDAMFETLMAVFAKARAIFFRRYVLSPSFKLAAVLLVMAIQGSVYVLAVAYVIAALVGVLLYVYLLRKVLAEQGLLAELPARRAPLPVRSLFGFSLPVMTTDLLMAVETPMVLVLLEHFHSTEQVAELNAVSKVAVLCLLVLQNSKILFKPAASRLYARGDEAGLGELYWRSAAWITIVTFPVFAVALFLAEPVTVLLFGERYAGAGVLLAVLAVGKFVNAALGMNTFTLQVHARVRLIVGINALSAALGLGLCLWLIPRHGALGGAYATSAAVVIRNVLNQIALARTTHVGFFPAHARRLYGSVLAAVAVLAAVRYATDSVYVLVPAVTLAALVLPRVNRAFLGISDTFPELARVPLLRRFLGVPAA